MKKKKVAVLFGGCSTEYEVSLKSAAAVIDNCCRDKYEIILIGITREGKWFRYYGDTQKIENDTWFLEGVCVEAIISPSRDVHGMIEFGSEGFCRTRIDVAFPVLHGKNGEDGTLQGLLEVAGIPFVGCDTLSSSMCMDKDIAHKIVGLEGIKTPNSICITKPRDNQPALDFALQQGFPVYVKPANAGSSMGITKANCEAELLAGMEKAFEHDRRVLIEENIDGFEVGCAVLGSDKLLTGEVDEIELCGGFFDYREKYTLETAKIHLPARIDERTTEKIKDTALIIYKALCCRGFARVDMFLTGQKEVVFNEINTIPGFTTKSRYPTMLCAVGLSYGEIIDNLINFALRSGD
ncbi:D-alanine--D-serine ligase VanG [Candidatus Contubernalis alkaliaceticus]|uniref:D-alanine--D-serine ligase VanG n=1 Tax=Candidatus Contubernalis alkaliaceticus TaxID=338645 RepID=UPI001F4C2B10|nr:D-alanine--D-serine ligase VanG [Candidatus Contubernalis alkalaceticus]UNC93024.1 D-alanine--D-serine ligase VanG [Candidatus Contubernalis alkalaceticus]